MITFQGNKELVDKVKKLLAVSIKGIKPTDEHYCENSEKKQIPVSFATLDPNSKWIDLSHGQLNVWCVGYASRCKDTALH